MPARNPFIASAVLLAIGLASLWSKWSGDAGISAGFPVSQWAVSLSGTVHGWPAMIGVVTLILAIVMFLWGLILSVLAE